MDKAFKKILSVFTPLTYLGFLQDLSGRKPVFPLYHAINDTTPLHLKHVQNVRSVKSFEKDLETFLQYFEPVSLDDYLAGSRKQNRDCMVLTFDDGLRECYDIVAPILKRKGIPAIFFINNDFIDNQDLFYRYKASLLINEYSKMEGDTEEMDEHLGCEKKYANEVLLSVKYSNRLLLDSIAESIGFSFEDYLKHNPVYLNRAQINTLLADGFDIGSHSFNHLDFDRISEEKARAQIIESVEELGEEFKLEKKYFSFPFSSDKVSLKMINTLLDEKKVDALFGTSGLKRYPLPGFIQRIPMEVNSLSALRILKTEFLYYIVKAPFGKNRYRGG